MFACRDWLTKARRNLTTSCEVLAFRAAEIEKALPLVREDLRDAIPSKENHMKRVLAMLITVVFVSSLALLSKNERGDRESRSAIAQSEGDPYRWIESWDFEDVSIEDHAPALESSPTPSATDPSIALLPPCFPKQCSFGPGQMRGNKDLQFKPNAADLLGSMDGSDRD